MMFCCLFQNLAGTYTYSYIIFILITLYFIFKWIKVRRVEFTFFKRLGIPYVKPHIIYGSLHELKRNRKTNEAALISKWVNEYGDAFGYYLGPKPYLVVADLDMVKEILIKEFHNFTNRPPLTIEVEPVMDTLVGLRDKKWKNVRSLLAPTFSSSKIKLMINIMNSKVDQLVQIIENDINKPLDLHFIYQGLTLDVISECALAMNTKCQLDQNNDNFFKSVRQFMKNAVNSAVIYALCFPSLAKILCFVSNNLALSGKATQIIISNLKRVIAYRRKYSDQRKNDMLQLMLDAKDENMDGKSNVKSMKTTLNDKEIIANSWVFLLGGFETTAGALTYTSYLLAKYPKVQDKLYKEISSRLQIKDRKVHVTYEDLNAISYLDQVLNESMRLYPPVATFVSRHAKEHIVIKNTLIPKGTSVVIPVWHIHHNPKYWPDPYEFNPERFSPSAKSTENRHSMAFIPFGEGPRKCIGMRFAQLEAKLALARLVFGYRLEFCAETPECLHFEIPTVSLNPVETVFIKFVKRDLI